MIANSGYPQCPEQSPKSAPIFSQHNRLLPRARKLLTLTTEGTIELAIEAFVHFDQAFLVERCVVRKSQ
jgi:hypothetical protein